MQGKDHNNFKKIIKFIGCYHGHVDSLLVKAGSGLATLGVPDSPGIPEELSQLTISLPYNDTLALEAAFKEHGDDIAAAIIEPIAGNMGFIEPDINFLKELRNLCTRNKTILIFDEVMTGFRVARGGVQELLGITPDLTALGKIVGGGLPVGVYGGRAEIMNNISPDGPVYQAGTLSGNPIAVSAGTALLKQLANKEIFTSMEENAKKFLNPIKKYADEIVDRFVTSPENTTILEFGCNDGVLLSPLAELNIGTLIGVDPASNVVKKIDENRWSIFCSFSTLTFIILKQLSYRPSFFYFYSHKLKIYVEYNNQLGIYHHFSNNL